MPKAATRLDYLIAMEWTEVECKQGAESWSLYDLTETQEALINKPTRREHNRWLFLEIGDGRAPQGREAYLIPGGAFVIIRDHYAKEGFKSVRFRSTERSRVPEAREAFVRYSLEWVPNKGWTIPDDHEWWNYDSLPEMLCKVGDDDKQPESSPAPARLRLLE